MITCCGKKQKTVAFICDPPEGYSFQRIDYLIYCKECKSTVLQVSRVDLHNHFSYFRRTNQKAKELFEKLRTTIRYKVPRSHNLVTTHSGYYLRYNHFGQIRKCYSNLSSLAPFPQASCEDEYRFLKQKSKVSIPNL